jgi:hypothetical protein
MLFKIFPGAQVGRHQLRLRQCSWPDEGVWWFSRFQPTPQVQGKLCGCGRLLRHERDRGGDGELQRATGMPPRGQAVSDAWKAAVYHSTLQSIDIVVGSGLHSVRAAQQRTEHGRVGRVHLLEPLASRGFRTYSQYRRHIREKMATAYCLALLARTLG